MSACIVDQTNNDEMDKLAATINGKTFGTGRVCRSAFNRMKKAIPCGWLSYLNQA
jgi:hypothetical protein